MKSKIYLTKCHCGATTSKHYAYGHGGKCKSCATGTPKKYRAKTLPLDRSNDVETIDVALELGGFFKVNGYDNE